MASINYDTIIQYEKYYTTENLFNYLLFLKSA